MISFYFYSFARFKQILLLTERMKLSLILTSIMATMPSNAYDIGCLYPDEMPDPFDARKLLVEWISARAIDEKRETPVVVRIALPWPHAT